MPRRKPVRIQRSCRRRLSLLTENKQEGPRSAHIKSDCGFGGRWKDFSPIPEIFRPLFRPDFDNLFLHLRFRQQGYWLRVFAGLFHVLVARRPQFEKRFSLFIEALALRIVEDRLSYDAID